jgi:uncharacterized protein
MNHNKKVAILLAVAMLSLGALSGCTARTPHQKLKWKAEDFFTDKSVVALCKAIEKKDLAEIDRLVNSGVNINAKGRENMTPLLWALPMGEEVFKKMLELGADPNVKLTKDYLLLSNKSVVFAAVELTDGLLHRQYFYDVPMDNYLQLVLEHGGNPNAEDLDKKTPLFWIQNRSLKVEEKMVRLLVAAGADINHRDCQGKTPLIDAAGRAGYFLCLLKAGADYRIVDNNGSDAVLWLDSTRRSLEKQMQERPNDESTKSQLAAFQPVVDWLAKDGVNWEAARAALNSPKTLKDLDNSPINYKHRPWLPQRPTLKKPEAKAKKP